MLHADPHKESWIRILAHKMAHWGNCFIPLIHYSDMNGDHNHINKSPCVTFFCHGILSLTCNKICVLNVDFYTFTANLTPVKSTREIDMLWISMWMRFIKSYTLPSYCTLFHILPGLICI